MAWNTGTSYTAASAWGATQANGVGNDLRTYGGNVDAAGYNLSNLGVLTIAAGGYINSSVGVGIAPTERLHVYQSVTATLSALVEQGNHAYNASVGIKSTRTWLMQSLGSLSGADGAWRLYDTTAGATRLMVDTAGRVTLGATPVYADNAAAVAGGLTAGMQYRTSTGVRMEVY